MILVPSATSLSTCATVGKKMAAEDENVDIEDEHAEDQTVKKAAKHDSMRAADLEKVTDYVEEAEILTQNIGDVSCVLNAPIIAIRAVKCYAARMCKRGPKLQRCHS